MARVCIAMSGGVDSTTTAYLLKEAGHEVFGLTMYLFDIKTTSGTLERPGFLEDASRVAAELGIEHDIIDLREVFNERIIMPFIEGYKKGMTPNPCAICNATIKYGLFMDEAIKRGAEYLATGHYVRLLRQSDGRIHLHEGSTHRKDQSFFLHGLTAERLEKLMLPLGHYSNKAEVRQIAQQYQTSVAEKKDSLGICFTQGLPPEDYLRPIFGEAFGSGPVLDLEGQQVGCHNGYYKFTRGQKKGFELLEAFKSSHKAMAVHRIDPLTASIVIGPESSLYSRSLIIEQMNWIFKPDTLPYEGEFKIFVWGYRLSGKIDALENGNYEVVFDQPVRAVAVGQACVVYKNDEILGGGIIAAFND